MLTTMQRHGWLTSTLQLVPVVAIAAAAMIAMAPADAGAAFNVKTFQCAGTGVDVDVSGLGNTNVCVEGISDVDLFCACRNTGGQCPNAANKQTRGAGAAANETLQPKNGRVRTTFSLQGVPPNQTQDAVCTAAAGTPFGDLVVEGPPLTCPGGQTAALVGSEATTTFTLCTTTQQPGEDCTCTGQGTLLAGPISCGPTESTSTDVGADCVALFPELTDTP
jgi:hypothetical protein